MTLSGLSLFKSMDASDNRNKAVDNSTIAESLGPGFAFLTSPKSQEVREYAASDEDVKEEDEEQTDATLIKLVKRVMIGKDYQVLKVALMDTESLVNIPLPMLFCDNGLVRLTSSKSSAKFLKSASPASSVSSPSKKAVTIMEEPTKIHKYSDTAANGSEKSPEESVSNEGLRPLQKVRGEYGMQRTGRY